jgi:hypothetical protein
VAATVPRAIAGNGFLDPVWPIGVPAGWTRFDPASTFSTLLLIRLSRIRHSLA